MLAMDRGIPHVRDIFAPYRGGSANKAEVSRKTEVRVYDYSPGSRRRNQIRDDSSSSNSSFSRDDVSTSSSPNDFIDTDHSDSTDNEMNQSNYDRSGAIAPNNDHRSSRCDSRHSSSSKKNGNRSGFAGDVNRNQGNRNEQRNRSASVERDGPGYSSKTLTDKDIKHLERHLSMKKTIRKQISRNLAQAFVEDPTVLEADTVQALPSNNEKNSNYSFTLTRAKVAKSEPTFLDMLKDPRKETDSGHSSPSHQVNYEDHDGGVERMDLDNYDHENQSTRVDVRGYEQIPVPDYQLQDNRNKNVHKESNTSPDHLKKGSFWKKFAFKGKARR